MGSMILFTVILILFGIATPLPEMDQDCSLALQSRNSIKSYTSSDLAKLHNDAIRVGNVSLSHYESLSNLSFSVQVMFREESSSDWIEHLTARVRNRITNNGHSITSVVTRQGQPVWNLYKHNGKLLQFKHPFGKVGGQKTESIKDINHIFLTHGLDSYFQCYVETLLQPWIGKKCKKPTVLQERFIEAFGVYVRKIGNRELIIAASKDPLDSQWDALYFDGKFLVRRIIFVSGKGGNGVVAITYSDFNQEAIPDDAFLPPTDLLEKSSGWQVLTEQEAVAKWKKNL